MLQQASRKVFNPKKKKKLIQIYIVSIQKINLNVMPFLKSTHNIYAKILEKENIYNARPHKFCFNLTIDIILTLH